ncbi:MAG: hypothetical protein RML36_08180 [Anaerolineae bacterium]|nr:hypothetical protein [Anaerolineae bacterium]MDW8099440.1 hypothetical protein [Anaerolineae bacterium]
MSTIHQLYSKIEQTIRPLVAVKHASHLSHRLWMVCGILRSELTGG